MNISLKVLCKYYNYLYIDDIIIRTEIIDVILIIYISIYYAKIQCKEI